jgi:hypothetical protein
LAEALKARSGEGAAGGLVVMPETLAQSPATGLPLLLMIHATKPSS